MWNGHDIGRERRVREPPRESPLLTSRGCRCTRGGVQAQASEYSIVIEIDPHTHAIVWQFGNGSDKAGPHSIVGTNDAERFGPLTLISGTGIPPASPPLPGCCEQQSHRRGQCRGRTRVGISHQHRIRQQLRSTADARRALGQQQHLLNTPGNGFNRLNGPYDAKVVGDFTGLTPPLGE